ncbi:CG34106, partial [Drosophila busckii]
ATNEVITTDQLKYRRLVASKDLRFKNRYDKLFSWYPEQQEIEYSRIREIYCESRQQYGDEQFDKFATRERLNDKHRCLSQAEQLNLELAEQQSKDQQQQQQPTEVNCFVPMTTNGEYGRCRPTHIHYCT